MISSITRILILGATGRTGSHIVQTAIENGMAVTCLARNSQRVPDHPLVRIVEGDPGQSDQLEEAIRGCTHVISALNISRKSDFPWSPLRTPSTYLSDVMKVLVPLAEKHSVKHISICSAWGVGDTRKDLPFWFRWTIDWSNIKPAYLDHERQELVLKESSLGWTIIRPVGLTNQQASQSIRESHRNSPKPGLLISRKAVAGFLLSSLFREHLIRKTVTISNK